MLALLVGLPARAQTLVQEFFVPLPATQVRIWADGIQDLAENETMRSVISMTVTADDTVIYFDHWENGYELEIAAPLVLWTGAPNDPGSQIWGDQDCNNGAIPTVTCTVGSDDKLNSGDVIILESDVPLGPGNVRNPAQTFFDGRDRFASTELLAVTRAAWPSSGVQAQLGGAVEVFDTSKWGTQYEAPIGENAGLAAFEYVGLSIMAEEDGTLVSVDANGDGDFVDANDLLNVPLNQGESLLAGAVGPTDDILVGAVVDASADVQVDLLTANEGTTYEGRWYSMVPTADWSNEYFSPVASTVTGDEVRLHLYNPGSGAITVKILELIAGVPTCTNQTVGAGATVEYTLSIESPLSAAQLLSDGTNCAAVATAGGDFFAIASIDRNATIHDWGFTLIPTSSLTPTAVAGWAPGSTDLSENVSPVWVTVIDPPGGTTTVYVDFDADPGTGGLIDAFGNRYDQAFTANRLEAIRIFDRAPPDINPADACMSGDCDQTGLRVYTIDGTRLTAAWGQDPAFSSSGQPQQLDMGTTVLPFSSLAAFKSGALLDDNNNNGGLDPGETVLYSIRVVNTGIVPISNIDLVDTLDPNTTYVLESTQVDGAAIPDDIAPDTPFPLDTDAGHPTGYSLVAPPDELAPGGEILITFVAQVNDPLPAGVEEIVNNVVVTSDSETFVDADVAPLPAGEVTVAKSSSAAGSPVVPGQAITYTVTVTNTSGSPVTGVELSDVLPAEVSYVPNSTVATGPEQHFVRDVFEAQSYANQDGPNAWNGPWVEIDAAGGGATGGDVQVFLGPANGELRMEDAGSAAARSAGDLTVIGGPNPFAALLFDFRMDSGVDTTDAVEIECSAAGTGGTFNPVPDSTLDGIDGDVNALPGGRLGYDLSACIPGVGNTAARFRFPGGDFDGGTEFFYTDVVDVRVAGDSREARDDFSSGYTGGSGVPCGNPPVAPCGWPAAPGGNWSETDAGGGGSGGGNVLVTVGGQLQLGGPVDGSAQREVDLSGSVFAILSFDYDTSQGIGSSLEDDDRLRVELSSSGVAGTFTAIGEFVNDPDGSRSYDITPFISANTAIRFRISQATEANEFFTIDNVRVKAGIQVADTKDNDGSAVPNPELVNGTPPVITLPADSFALAPGEVMTATFQVIADSPLTVPFLTNTAIARTFENPNPVQGRVTDFVSPGGAIGDLVWLDVDEDGFYDIFEPGLANVRVELRDGVCTPLPSGMADCPTTLTNANGEYLFDRLPAGTYEVFVDETTIPTGLSIAPGSVNPVAMIVITATEVFLDVDFGYSPAPTLGALGDYVWNDSDGDGIQDPGELGIAGVTVRLLDAATGAVVDTVVTGADGKYLFTDVTPGEYIVAIDPAELGGGGDLDGFSATTGPQSIGSATSAPFTLAAGEAITDLDFGYANACLPRIDFETDSTGTALVRGQVIDSEFSRWGVAVSFTANAPGTGPAMIFATQLPTGGDLDLGSPNQTCMPPGLGQGLGGELGQPGENCVPQGNVLIISEDGDATDPDDNLNGGTITFDFNYDVDIASIDFMDGNSPGNTVETFDAGLMSLGTVAIADLGSNSVQSVAVGETGVRRLTVVLDDAGALAAIDFCASPPLHPVSDTVWLDENGDGTFSPGEQAIAGVTVSLLDAGGNVIGTAVSGPDGKFVFPLVPDGSYTIRIDDSDAKLTEFFGTTAAAKAAALPITVAGGPVSGINFGYYAPGNIGDLVWSDANGNGVRDEGEPGIEGVTLDLVDATTGMVVGTTTTAADGSYLFRALPVGSYSVRVTDVTMVLTGYAQTADPSEPGVPCGICNAEGSTTVTLNRSDLAQDFGYRRTVPLPVVSGTVFLDPDRDGVLDSGEPRFEGVTVTLFDAGPDGIFGTNDDLIVAETRSDPAGFYTFPDIPPGNYQVAVTDRARILEGYTLTSGLDAIPITVAGMDVTGIDFGYIRDPGTASIGDTVWLDVNGDGVASASEPGLSRVTVDLINIGPDGILGTADDVGVVASTVSDANGKYVFPDLPAGNYVVDVTDTNSILTDLSFTAGTTDPSAVIRLSEGERFTDADFGYVPTGATAVLGDRVWYSANGDGVQDPGEVGIEGIDVQLLGPSCVTPCTVTTGPDGIWLAKNLAPGQYTVTFDDADVAALGYDTQPTNMTAGNDTYVVTVMAGDIVTTLDFGFDGGAVGSIGDRIWIDEDGDGLQDPGEPGLEEVTINLVDASGDIIATTTTDMSGNYLFTGVPDDATYTVVVSDINGVTDLLQQTGDPDEGGVCSTCDMQASVTIPAGGALIDTIDFGYAPSGGTGTISNFIWHDINRDGIQDPTEPGIEGVYVELWVDIDGDGVITPGVDNRVRTEFTDVNGEYEFKSLPPEDYVVRVAPENFFAGAVLEGFDQTHDPNLFGVNCGAFCDNLGDLTVVAGAGNFDQDFGYAGPLGAGLSIAGTVFEDADRSTTLNSEPLVDGATVRLFRDLDGDGVLDPGEPQIAVTTSGPSGAYSFTDLPPGDYIVTVGSGGTSVEDYIQTTQQGGGFPENGVQPVTLVASDSTGNDFGFWNGGITTTPVTLAYFEARGDGTFRWMTSTEVGNLGFNLYALTDSGFEQLNRELIASPVVDSLEPQTYEFESTFRGTAFLLEDVDIHGAVRHHGPFYLDEAKGSRVDRAKPVAWGEIRSETASRAQARAASRASARAAERLGGSSALQGPRAEGSLGRAVGAIGTSGGDKCTGCDRGRRSRFPTVSLGVDREGVYRVSYETLQASGLDFTNARTDWLAVTREGIPVPIHVSGGATFGPGSFLEFVGEPVDSLYTKSSIYRLSVDRQRAARAQTLAFAGGGAAEIFYLETTRFENQSKYHFASPTEDPWYDLRVLATSSPAEASVPFALEGWVPGAAPVTLDVALFGGTDFPTSPDHHVIVEVNGYQMAEEWFDGLAVPELVAEVSDGTLSASVNTLTMKLPHDTGAQYDLVNYDHLIVTYPRAFAAADGALDFASSGSDFAVTGFVSSDVVAYARLNGALARLGVQVGGAPGAYEARFGGIAGFGESAEYWVASGAGVLTPSIAHATEPVDWVEREVDVVVVSHSDFIDGLAPWVSRRESEGLSVKVVDVEALYATFTHGVVDPEAIRRYARAAHAWGARYLLLVGGDTYDYFDYLGVGSVSFVPSLYARTDTIVSYAPVDPLYGDVDGDLVPDMAVGRWPVRTAAELEAVLSKTLSYSNVGEGLTAVMASDGLDLASGYSFANDSEDMAAILGGSWQTDRVYLDEMDVPEAREALISGMSSGPSLTSYFGHSGLTVWSFDGLFTSDDVGELTNAGDPTVVTQWGCWNTYHVLPTYETLGNQLLLAPDRGAAAVLGASTLTEALSERRLGRRVFERLAAPGVRLGDAITAAKQDLAETDPGRLDVILGWTLLGDPTLTIVPEGSE